MYTMFILFKSTVGIRCAAIEPFQMLRKQGPNVEKWLAVGLTLQCRLGAWRREKQALSRSRRSDTP